MLTVLLWLWRPPAPRERAAAFMATAWNIPALLAVHVLATRAGWWTFDAHGATLAGFPVDLYAGWAIMWGALPVLAGRRISMAALVLAAIVLDLVAMPAMTPVVRLGDNWLVGEAVAVALCLVPAQLLASWTRNGAYPERRAFLLAIAFSALVLGVLPQVILEQTGGNWAGLTSRPQRTRRSARAA